MNIAEIPVNQLTQEEAREELARIAAEMAKSDIAYYQDDAPYLTDSQYDALKHRNQDIEALFPELIRYDSPSKKLVLRFSALLIKSNTAFPCFPWLTYFRSKKSMTLS